MKRGPPRLIVIGVSAGGFTALKKLLGALPATFPVPLLIVQHQRPGHEGQLAAQLGRACALHVKEADGGEEIHNGGVYLAPANYHLLVERDGSLSLSVDQQVCYARPSVDVLFESAALAFGAAVVGVILTGANHDGSAGLKAIKEHGGIAVVQDPADAEVSQMPLNAIRSVAADYIVTLAQLPGLLCTLVDAHPRLNSTETP